MCFGLDVPPQVTLGLRVVVALCPAGCLYAETVSMELLCWTLHPHWISMKNHVLALR